MATQLSITYNEPGTGKRLTKIYKYGPGETELEALLFVLKAFHFIYDQEVRKHIEYEDDREKED